MRLRKNTMISLFPSHHPPHGRKGRQDDGRRRACAKSARAGRGRVRCLCFSGAFRTFPNHKVARKRDPLSTESATVQSMVIYAVRKVMMWMQEKENTAELGF